MHFMHVRLGHNLTFVNLFQILKTFSNSIFSFDNPLLNQELTEFLINHSDEFAEALKLLKLAAGDFKRSSQGINVRTAFS